MVCDVSLEAALVGFPRGFAPAGNGKIVMKRSTLRATPANASNGGDGHSTGAELVPRPAELNVILESLQTMRDGDFSVRLPGTWTGLAGKIADTFNEIVTANQQMAQELKRVGQVVGKEGRTRERMRFHESRGAWGEMEVSVNTLVEDLLRPTADVTACHRRRGPGKSDADCAARCGRSPPGRRVPAFRQNRQYHDSAAQRFHG